MNGFKLGLLACTSIALSWPLAAQAQSQNNPQTSGGPTTKGSTALEEVIVTAQKRQENLQAVPVTVTALSAKALVNAHVTGTYDLTLVTPGLSFSHITSQASPTIRGVATRGIGPGDEPSVPIYIDGVYQSSTASGFFQFNNIDQVEVLKGPQGTLFGRNAEGGVISITTAQPKFTPFLSADASYGSYGQRAINAYGTTPITDKLAVNIAFHDDGDDGYIHNIATGQKQGRTSSDAVRAKLLWKPTDRISLTLGANYTESQDDSAFSGYPLDGNTIDRTLIPNAVIAGPNQTAVVDTYSHVRQVGAYGNLVINFDGFNVSLLQSWLDTDSALRTDSSLTPLQSTWAAFPTADTSYTTELRFTSAGNSKFQWIAGGFFYRDNGGYGTPTNPFEFVPGLGEPVFLILSKIGTTSEAAFAEMTYHLTDKLAITGGLRYTAEQRDKSFSFGLGEQGATPGSVILPAQPYTSLLGTGSHNYSNVSGRASIQYSITDQVHSYFTFSQGFKSGFANASSAPSFVNGKPEFNWLQPETLNDYEIGLKSDITNKFRLNLDAFYLDYYNLQVSSRAPNGTSATTDVFNAASATNYGFEATAEWHPTDAWLLGAGMSNQHARYNAFPLAQVYYPATSTDATTNAAALAANPCQYGTGTQIGGNRAAICSAAGKPLARSPDWTADLTAQYTTPLFGGSLQLGGVVSWTDDFIWDLYGTLDNGGGHFTVNGHATWTAADNRTSIEVWGQNLTDSRQPLNRFQGSAGTYAIEQMPVSFGLKISYRTN